MRGRLRFFDASPFDTLALPDQQSCAPAHAGQEQLDPRIAYGFGDFLFYVFILCPVVAAYPGLFYLWALTLPVAFLSTVTPIGPFTAWHSRRESPRVPAHSSVELERALIARRQHLQDLANETVALECELSNFLDGAGDLRSTLEAQIRQAQTARGRIYAELARIDSELFLLGQ